MKKPKKLTTLQAQKQKISFLERLLKKSEYRTNYLSKKLTHEVEKRWDEDKLVEELKGMQSIVKPLKPYSRPKRDSTHKDQDLVLLFGDCQLGEKIQVKETGYKPYNIDIFKQRLDFLYESVMNITDRHRKDFNIPNLNIFMLGDIVEGSKIFRGQGSRIETDEVEQMFEGQEMISNFLRSLARNYDHISVPCVYGNHGRVADRKDQDLGYVNWDYLVYRNMKQILSGVKNIDIKVDKSWWRIEEVGGWKFHMEHGDRIKRYMQIPWYGAERNDNRTFKMMSDIGKEIGKDYAYDYYVFGHHHVPWECDANRGERICNGTFSSGNPYAMRDLKVTARPTQKLFGVHPEVGISFRYNIRLDLPAKALK